jgi:hypothetical protein
MALGIRGVNPHRRDFVQRLDGFTEEDVKQKAAMVEFLRAVVRQQSTQH